MTRVVAIGEAMVELAPRDDASTFKIGFAGDTMNTAWYLRALMSDTDQIDYCTAVGTDTISDQLVDFLGQSGLGTDHIFRRPDKSVGLYMIQLTNGERSFSYWRGESAARTLADDQTVLATALKGADVAYFSGITLAILSDDDRNRLLAALKAFRANGGLVAFDPNLRPRLWPDTKRMLSAIMDAAAVSDIALPSYEDEADWFGDATPSATARRYQKAGATTVIVKNGAGEMTASENGILSQHMPLTVKKIVDTTAAGDSFNAGFLASMLSGQDIKPAINAGAALSAQVIQARGALVDITDT